MRTDILERKDEILQWIEEEQPKNFIAKQLGCKQETLNSYLKKMGIDYAGQQNEKGQQKGPNTYKPANEYLGTGKSIKSHELKLKLIRDKIKEDKCEICNIKIWQGVELPLELHHKDGNHFNNNLDNLMILCPNCHSIQNGNSAKNIGKYKTDEFEKRLKQINPDIEVIKITKFIDNRNIDELFKEKIDYFIDACDSFNTKCLVIEKCLNKNIPFITCTGTGNRMDPSKLYITDIRKTTYDPLAKKIRKYIKDNSAIGPVICLSSKEIPIRKGKVIGSNSFVPPSARLLIASYVINNIIGRIK